MVELRRTFALVAALPLLARAQSPRITPQGDPSVKADSIYRLAVDPKDYPDYPVAILLDDGVVRVEADGQTSKTYRTIVQILKPEAEQRYQEQTFSYAPKHQRLTVNWIRVVKPNGDVVSAEPSHVQDSDIPAERGDPVYSDQKVRRVSLSGVKAGTIVDYSYTTEELKPFLARDFLLRWRVNSGPLVRRSRYVVDLPEGLKARVVEQNLGFAKTSQVVNGRRIDTWAAADVPAVRPEPLAADSNGVTMWITISSPLGWNDIGAWYATNAQSRYALSADVERKVAALTAGAKSLDDSIRAVHRWVAQDIRYVSIALGLGGYQPRTPDEVVRTGFGDCKDKATLFVAALAKLGVPAFPVLLNAFGRVDRRVPSVDQFNHVIAAVKRGGHYEFTDLTADILPYGELPYSEQGQFGVLVHPDGAIEEVTFPKQPLEHNATATSISGALAEDGSFKGAVIETAAGARQIRLRERMRHPLDSAAKTNIANALARSYFEGAQGDSLQAFDGLDLTATPRVRALIRTEKAAFPAGENLILQLPFRPMGSLAVAARELENAPKRRFSIDPERFWGYGVSQTELRVQLPAGWTAQLPKDVTASSAFGSYTAEYRQSGAELTVRHRVAGAGIVQPPERVRDLVNWLRAVAQDDARMIVLEKPKTAPLPKP